MKGRGGLRLPGRFDALGFAVFLTLVGCGEAPPPVEVVEPRSAREQDLDALRAWVDQDVSFSSAGRTAAKARIDEIEATGPAVQNPAFFLQVASVVGLADNGHSNMGWGTVGTFGVLPFRTYWFSDGLYVVRARADHADLLGARVEAIEGVPPSELLQRMGLYHGGTDEHFMRYASVPLFLSGPLLEAAGVATSGDSIRVTFTLMDGGEEERTVPSDPLGTAPVGVNPWRTLIPDAIGSESGWTAFSPDAQPEYLREPTAVFRYRYLADLDAAYVQFRANIDRNGESVDAFVQTVRSRLTADQPTHVIWDQRQNPGGDLTRTASLAMDLPTLASATGTVFVLTDPGTFSAGIYTAFYPKSADPARTRIVGGLVGDRERFFAETNGPVRLPFAGFTIGTSLAKHDLGAGCLAADCFFGGAGLAQLDLAVGSFDPDVPIETTFADYRAGIDPVMAWVRSEIEP